jgi:hypothetical protein
MKIRLYCNRTVGLDGFNQISIWPGLCFVVNTMDPDATTMVLGANILVWDLGIMISWRK